MIIKKSDTKFSSQRMKSKGQASFQKVLLVLFSILVLIYPVTGTTIITDTSVNIDGNLTLGQKITFTFGEMIDNIVDGWIRITGSLNITENVDVQGNVTATYFIGNGSKLTDLDWEITGESIGNLSDVNVPSPSNSQVLKYNSTSSKWEAQTDETGGGSGDTIWTNNSGEVYVKQGYPTNLNISGNLTAKTGRTATIVVAANDSLATSKAQADYVCDGTDDQVEIQAAIDALASTGGVVQLTEGNFYLGAAAINLNKTAVSLVGFQTGFAVAEGSFGTTIYQTNAGKDAIVISAVQANVKDVYIRGAVFAGGHFGEVGIRVIGGQDNKIDNVKVSQFVLYGIFFDNINNIWLTNSRITSCGKNLYAYGSHDIVIANNQFELPSGEISVHLQSCYGTAVTGNLIENGGETTLRIHTCVNSIFVGNCIHGSPGQGSVVYIYLGHTNVISGNYIGEAHDGEAVHFSSTLNNVFSDNVLAGTPAGEADIYLRNGNEGNLIVNNHCTSPNVDYSIRVHYDENKNNLISGNYCSKPIIDTSGNINPIRNNIGHVTENSGNAIISSGNTFTDVAHSLNITPAISDISVTPTNNLSSANIFWVSEPVTSSSFRINVDQDPSGYANFTWQIGSY